MITITIDDKAVKELLKQLPKTAGRAAEKALDDTAREIKKDVIAEMKRVFDRPTPFTLNSLKTTLTQNHNMEAKVWFKEPERMGEHYLIPQVEGGMRKSKGLERALNMQFTPADELGLAKIDRYGNIPGSQVMQIMSVLGVSERWAGHTSNTTKRSRNKGKERDYVFFPFRHTNLAPGVYKRIPSNKQNISPVRGRYSTINDHKSHRAGGAYAWQTGKHKAVIRARGLAPVMFKFTRKPYRPLLDFYGIANKTYDRVFITKFNAFLTARLR